MLQQLTQDTQYNDDGGGSTSYDLNDVQPPELFVKEHPDLFTDSQLNWLLKTRHKNGLQETGAILKISGKLYLNKPIFIDWVMNQKAS